MTLDLALTILTTIGFAVVLSAALLFAAASWTEIRRYSRRFDR